MPRHPVQADMTTMEESTAHGDTVYLAATAREKSKTPAGITDLDNAQVSISHGGIAYLVAPEMRTNI